MTEKYVLIVDDDPTVRLLLTDALELLELPSRAAKDGLEALEMIKENLPQAIIADLMMPRMSGFGMLSQLQRHPKTRRIPVILLSGIADNVPNVRRIPSVVAAIRKGDFSMDGLRTSLTKAGIEAH